MDGPVGFHAFGEAIAAAQNSTKRSTSFKQKKVTVSVPAIKKDVASKEKDKDKEKDCDKPAKGLRHLSLKVCEKVEEKRRTTYSEVADELVQEILRDEESKDEVTYDEKNIRRRVYDALNVLLAMNMIEKDKKEIRWKGLPSDTQAELEHLKQRKLEMLALRKDKQAIKTDLLTQLTAFKAVILRNQENPSPDTEQRVYMPFITIKTDPSNHIECEITEDLTEVFFNFESPFQINSDNDILKMMGLHIVNTNDYPHLFGRIPDVRSNCRDSAAPEATG